MYCNGVVKDVVVMSIQYTHIRQIKFVPCTIKILITNKSHNYRRRRFKDLSEQHCKVRPLFCNGVGENYGYPFGSCGRAKSPL